MCSLHLTLYIHCTAACHLSLSLYRSGVKYAENYYACAKIVRTRRGGISFYGFFVRLLEACRASRRTSPPRLAYLLSIVYAICIARVIRACLFRELFWFILEAGRAARRRRRSTIFPSS